MKHFTTSRLLQLPVGLALCLALCAGPLRGASQTTAADAPSVKIVTLGTAGGPLPRKDRTQSSNLLVVNGTLYVIDAGDNVTRRIVQAGYDFKKVGKIFITHDHSDHTLGLATLLISEWEYQHRDPIDVYGPPGTAALVSGVLQYGAVNADIRFAEGKTSPMAPIFAGHDAGTGVIYRDANVTVTAVENTHFHFQPGTPPYGKYKSYSYRFDTPRGSILFTGDTGPSDAVTTLAKGADVLVTEINSTDDIVNLYKANGVWQAKTPDEQAGFVRHLKEEHLEPSDVGTMAAKAGVKSVILTHLPPTGDPNDTYARYADGVKKIYTGPVSIAKDLMVFSL
jgi:ribonuclease BN (tRNA processing enzyme)